MAIDVSRELERICRDGSSLYPPSEEDLNALLARILKSGSAEEFRTFFDGVIARRKRLDGGGVPADATLDELLHPGLEFPRLVDEENHEALMSPLWLPRFADRHLPLLCETLRHRYHYDGCRSRLGEVVADGRIAAARRAMLCRAVFDCEAFAERTPRGFVHLPPLWYYNRSVCGRIMDVKNCREHRGIRKIGVSRHDGFRTSTAMERGVSGDNYAIFEINRELEDRKIDNPMLEHLIRSDAARCFTGLMANYPERVFKLRSPEEWLITVCRYAREKLAVTAVAELERQFPGIVRQTRDPWGNTPLWNTFFNLEPTEKLRAELLRLGCDSNDKNEWGLSYQLLKDNDPKKMRQSAVTSSDPATPPR